MSIKNVIFDWSGTLCDDTEFTYRANNWIHEKLGNPSMTRAEFLAVFELPVSKYVSKMYPGIKHSVVDELYVAACRKFDRLQDKVTPVNQAQDIVKYLQSKGYRLFVFSAAGKPMLLRQIAALQLRNSFTWVTGGVSDKVSQLPEFMRQHALNPAETAYVGDMPHDIEAGLAAGCRTIGTITGYGTAEQLRAAFAAHAAAPCIIQDLEQLPPCLRYERTQQGA